MNGFLQYPENIHTSVSKTICALNLSVAVHSMKTSLVLRVILEWLPFIIGGSESTTPLLSVMTGYTGLFLGRSSNVQITN